MKMNRRIRAVAGGLAVAAMAVAITTSSVNAASPPPVDASHDHITCTTVYGSSKMFPALDLVGGQPTTSTFSLKLDGCTDTDNPAVKIAGSSMKGTIGFSDNFITALQGIKTVTASFTISWKVASGAPKLTSPTTTLTFTQLNGTSLALGGNFTDQYANLKVGNDLAHGPTVAPTVTGSFAGTDSGATTTLDALGSLSVAALAGPTYIGNPKGLQLKALPIAIGQLHLG
jgi:hypothetical protein